MNLNENQVINLSHFLQNSNKIVNLKLDSVIIPSETINYIIKALNNNINLESFNYNLITNSSNRIFVNFHMIHFY